MSYKVVVAYTAQEQFKRLDARWRSAVKQALRKHLEEAPTRESKSMIKRLRSLQQPQYRLRVGPIRVYYDVNETEKRVEVLGFVMKPESTEWLEEHGVQQ